MIFSEMYPAAKEGTFMSDAQTLTKTKKVAICFHCGDHTHFFDSVSSKPICSTECRKETRITTGTKAYYNGQPQPIAPQL